MSSFVNVMSNIITTKLFGNINTKMLSWQKFLKPQINLACQSPEYYWTCLWGFPGFLVEFGKFSWAVYRR